MLWLAIYKLFFAVYLLKPPVNNRKLLVNAT